MNKAEAKANQDRIALNYKLEWWYGTHCEKCCGIYPKPSPKVAVQFR